MKSFAAIDWIVLILTLLLIISYGVYKSRTTRNLDGYFLSNRTLPWYLVLLSIMGTQASAVTFLSGPGQAYTDGMRFVQYYFGLPLAMVVICITFVPVFHKLKLYTAYEFLERRFDLKTRTLTSFLFLLSRGVSTGISIAAPSIILSALLGWDIFWTNIFMGGLLIIYTVTGGAKAVAYTQQLQMVIIFTGMFLAGYMVVRLLPAGVGFFDALHVTGRLGKLNVFTSGATENGFDWKDKYNIWSGVIGGFFLALSYFGTDQSQVGRYLTAKSISESRVGLLMNGLVKVPMQFLILLVGALVFTFYQFNDAPLFFNGSQLQKVSTSIYKDSLQVIQNEHNVLAARKKEVVQQFTDAIGSGDKFKEQESGEALKQLHRESESVRVRVKSIINKPEVKGDDNDTNYIFLKFVVDYLPRGLVGLLIAIIFLAAWGSIAAALNSLASCSIVDFHRRFSKKDMTDETEYKLSRWYTILWGAFCIVIAQFAYNIGNSLIEAVNVLGSLFYGVILGIFITAFYAKQVTGRAVFLAAVIVEAYIILSFSWPWIMVQIPGLTQFPAPINSFMLAAAKIGFLWLNVIGAVGVVVIAWLLEQTVYRKRAFV